MNRIDNDLLVGTRPKVERPRLYKVILVPENRTGSKAIHGTISAILHGHLFFREKNSSVDLIIKFE